MPPNAGPYLVEIVHPSITLSATMATFSTPEEVEAFLAKEWKANSVLTVVRVKNDADYGNYIAFVNADNIAHVRVLAHRGFYAKSSASRGEPNIVAFQDESGCEFVIEETATVSLNTATEALKHWLPSQECSPTIAWGEE